MEKIRKNKKEQVYWITMAVSAALISILSITNGSMWGDEICRVEDAVKGYFADMWRRALGYGQPGYMTFMFLWVRLAGKTEFLMRTSNLVFVGIAFYYIYRIMQYKKYHPLFSLLFFIHPMFVYYMDEVTPYIIRSSRYIILSTCIVG